MKSKVLVGGFRLRVFPHRKYSTSWGKKVSSSFETEYRVHRDIDWVDAGPTGTPILKMSVSLHAIRTLYKRLVCGQHSSLSRTIVSLPGSDRQVQADSPNGKLTKVLKNAEERWHLPFINRTVYRFSTDEEARAAKHRLEAEGAVFYYARSDLNVQTDIRVSSCPNTANFFGIQGVKVSQTHPRERFLPGRWSRMIRSDLVPFSYLEIEASDQSSFGRESSRRGLGNIDIRKSVELRGVRGALHYQGREVFTN
mmetsp:Transcript_29229/g.113414  ORF Transcript_29229/g.113414 Transcript_29229/m.113414 type:complete len:253 (-) Transcript_29229:1332-2090(-)